MAPRRRMARNQWEHDTNEYQGEHNLIQALHWLITQAKEPNKRGRAYYLEELEKMMPSLNDWYPYSDITRGWILEIKKKMNSLNVPICFGARLAM